MWERREIQWRRAKNALSELTGNTPSVRGSAKNSIRDFNIHKGEPIGNGYHEKNGCGKLFKTNNRIKGKFDK